MTLNKIVTLVLFLTITVSGHCKPSDCDLQSGTEHQILTSSYAGDVPLKHISECCTCQVVRSYYNNGRISEEGTWHIQHWVGEYRLYYENGTIRHAFFFNEKGQREGIQRYYYENGQLALETTFHEGKEVGTRFSYDELGCLSSKTEYFGGIAMGNETSNGPASE